MPRAPQPSDPGFFLPEPTPQITGTKRSYSSRADADAADAQAAAANEHKAKLETERERQGTKASQPPSQVVLSPPKAKAGSGRGPRRSAAAAPADKIIK